MTRKDLPRTSTVYDVGRLTEYAARRPEQRMLLTTARRVGNVLHYFLEHAGTGGYWHGRTRIEIDAALGEKLAASWRQNQYRQYVGARSLRRIVRDLTGVDVLPRVEALREEAKNEQARARARTLRTRLARALREVLDVVQECGPAAAETLRVGAIVTTQQQARVLMSATSELSVTSRLMLNTLTTLDATCAQDVARTEYGVARNDD